MKVLVNGGLNLSELDGWWAEAYTPEVGWALGDRQDHDGDADWDAREAEKLYRVLEDEVYPGLLPARRLRHTNQVGSNDAGEHGYACLTLFREPNGPRVHR